MQASNAVVDPSDLEQFVVEERRHLVRFAWALSGDLATAEDVVQDVLIELARRWSGIADPRSYARRAIVNRVRSRWRSRGREAAALERVATVVQRDPAEPEDSGHVWAAVRSLPWRQRVAVVLAVVEDRTLLEVGVVLGCAEATARTHLRRGRARLAQLLVAEKESDR